MYIIFLMFLFNYKKPQVNGFYYIPKIRLSVRGGDDKINLLKEYTKSIKK